MTKIRRKSDDDKMLLRILIGFFIFYLTYGVMAFAAESFPCPYRSKISSKDVPFELRGFGIQLWQGDWARLHGEKGYEEYVEALDRLTCTNSNL